MTLPTLNTQTITVTDPLGKNAVYAYADGALVAGRPTCSAA